MHPLTDAATRAYNNLVDHGAATPAGLADRIGRELDELDPLPADPRRLRLVEAGTAAPGVECAAVMGE